MSSSLIPDMPATNRNIILLGTNKGLHLFVGPTHKMHPTKTIIEDEWITSIATNNSTVLITTREGAYYEYDYINDRIDYCARLPFRTWFTFVSDEGDIAVGGTGPNLFHRTANGEWVPNEGLRSVSNNKRWQSHSGRNPHFHSAIRICGEHPCIAGGLEEGGVITAEDSLSEWKDITSNIDPDVHCLVAYNESHLAAATGTGVFTYCDKRKVWSLLGNPILPYCQGVVFRPSTNSFIVTGAQSPYGRVTEGVYSGVSPNNIFGIHEVSLDGAWITIEARELSLSGVLSKAIKQTRDTTILGAIDGSVYFIEKDNGCYKFDDEVEGIIECIEIIEND